MTTIYEDHNHTDSVESFFKNNRISIDSQTSCDTLRDYREVIRSRKSLTFVYARNSGQSEWKP